MLFVLLKMLSVDHYWIHFSCPICKHQQLYKYCDMSYYLHSLFVWRIWQPGRNSQQEKGPPKLQIFWAAHTPATAEYFFLFWNLFDIEIETNIRIFLPNFSLISVFESWMFFNIYISIAWYERLLVSSIFSRTFKKEHY